MSTHADRVFNGRGMWVTHSPHRQLPAVGFPVSTPPATVARVTCQHQIDDGLPPLPSPDATDAQRGEAIMARLVARIGAPSLEDYRRAYAGCGAQWPGDEEIRRRHPVAADPAA
ncbi:MAG: hypothetical protein ACRDQZ_18135 [Mycobacteriales bacterium]